MNDLLQKILERLNSVLSFQFDAHSLISWLYVLLVMQLHFYVLSMAGGVVLGVFPAIYVLHRNILRLRDYRQLMTVSQIIDDFRRHFFAANLLGYGFVVLIIMLSVNASNSHLFGQWSLLLYYISMIGLLFVCSSALFCFAMMVDCQLNTIALFRLAILYSFGHLVKTILLACLLASVSIVLAIMPMLAVFWGASLIVLIVHWVYTLDLKALLKWQR